MDSKLCKVQCPVKLSVKSDKIFVIYFFRGTFILTPAVHFFCILVGLVYIKMWNLNIFSGRSSSILLLCQWYRNHKNPCWHCWCREPGNRESLANSLSTSGCVQGPRCNEMHQLNRGSCWGCYICSIQSWWKVGYNLKSFLKNQIEFF